MIEDPSVSPQIKKIALVLNDDFSMYHFRKGLIRSLVARGHDITVIVPPGDYIQKLEALGVRVIPLPIERFVSPVADMVWAYRLWRIFKSGSFDIVHNMTIKPNIFGTLAAYLAGIERIVCLVSGIGFTFQRSVTLRERILKTVAVWLYRLAMRLADRTWFQNKDDLRYFIDRKIIAPEKGIVIRSGGINTDEFSLKAVSAQAIDALKAELQLPPEARCVLMVAARLIWSKGVGEYVEAAQRLMPRYPDWYFIMVCPKDPGSPDHVPDAYVRKHRCDQLIIIDTFRSDIEVFEAMADIMVLPSFYREGVPRTLLEGLSMGKPIITTDHPGCREVVDAGVNGFLIPIRDTTSLADRLAEIMSEPEKRMEFGRRSRAKAKEEFDEGIVVQKIIKDLYAMPI